MNLMIAVLSILIFFAIEKVKFYAQWECLYLNSYGDAPDVLCALDGSEKHRFPLQIQLGLKAMEMEETPPGCIAAFFHWYTVYASIGLSAVTLPQLPT